MIIDGPLAVDPEVFIQSNTKSHLQIVLQFHDIILKEGLNSKFILDKEGILVRKYLDTNKSSQLEIVSKENISALVAHQIASLASDDNLKSYYPLPKDYDDIIDTCSDVHRILVSLAICYSEIIVLLADNYGGQDGLYDPNTRKLICEKLGRPAILYVSEFIKPVPLVITEGSSDWKHIKAALQKFHTHGEYLDLWIHFLEFGIETKMGSNELLKTCKYGHRTQPKDIVICIFDHDEPSIVTQISDCNLPGNFKSWGSHVYSFPIPIPSHRLNPLHNVCIEFCYRDDEIQRFEFDNGRRLFLSNEFSEKSGRHKIKRKLIYQNINRLKKQQGIFIIDELVFNENDENIALPKERFAENVLFGEANFNDFDFLYFQDIFDVVLAIIEFDQSI